MLAIAKRVLDAAANEQTHILYPCDGGGGDLEELLSALRVQFPDVTITYREEWVQRHLNVKVFVKGIYLDWS